MAINPEIAFKVKAPDVDSPLDAYVKAANVRNMLAQGPLREAQLEQTRLENDQKRLEIANLPAKQKAAATLAESVEKTAELTRQKDQLDNAKKQQSMISSAIGGVKYAPEADRPARYQSARAELIQQGLIKPEQAPEQYEPGFVDQQFFRSIDAEKQVTNAHQELKDKLDKDKAAQEALEAPFKLKKAEADATSAGQKAAGTEPIQPKDKLTMDRAEQQFTEMRRHNAATEGLTAQGQKLTDARGRDLAEATRDAAKQAREDKPPTAAQNTVATYAERLQASNKALESITQGGAERVFNMMAPNFLETEAGQAFDQAERNYINATLRRESGAVISPSEFVEARKQYIPQPGDKPAVLKLKAENRKMVAASFKKAAGKAFTDPDELVKPTTSGTRPPLSSFEGSK